MADERESRDIQIPEKSPFGGGGNNEEPKTPLDKPGGDDVLDDILVSSNDPWPNEKRE